MTQREPATRLLAPAARAPFLRAYQARTLLGLLRGAQTARGATFTVMFPRQSGKNEVAAALVACLLWTNAARGGSVVVCAPAFRPQSRISIERTREALAALAPLAPPGVQARTAGNVITFGRARAVFLSAAVGAHVAGHTASLGLIADEAQEIEATWFDRQFRPMAASTGAPTALFGTPWDGTTLLERAAAANREHDTRGGAVRLHHEVSWREVAASLPAYGDYVRYERNRLGPNHPLYLSQYELVASDAAGRLLSRGQLALIEGSHPRECTPRPGERYAGGLDLGGEGQGADATVLSVARLTGNGSEVAELATWRGAPFETVLREVTALARRWRLDRLTVDATGLGAPLARSLESALGPRVEPFVFTAQSKSALGFSLLAAVETGRFTLFADDGSAEAASCRAELRACRASYRGGRLWWWGEGQNDDYVASLALCQHAAETAGSPRLAVGRPRD